MSSHLGLPALDVSLAFPQATPASVFPPLGKISYSFCNFYVMFSECCKHIIHYIFYVCRWILFARHWYCSCMTNSSFLNQLKLYTTHVTILATGLECAAFPKTITLAFSKWQGTRICYLSGGHCFLLEVQAVRKTLSFSITWVSFETVWFAF